MIKKVSLSVLLCCGLCFSQSVFASTEAEVVQRAESYYNAVKTVCSGIADSISQISGIAKANTAVGAAGTAIGVGAVAVGASKASVDAEIKGLLDDICELGGCEAEKIRGLSKEGILKIARNISEIQTLAQSVQTKTDKSVSLGNWRTGLMAGNIATNVASAVMAGLNSDKSDLVQQIQACNAAVKAATDIKQEVKSAGINPAKYPIVTNLESVTTWCGNLSADDVENIEKKMKGVMGASVAGAAVGAAGVAVSVSANSDKVRKGDENKEKKLNTAANVLSGATVATSAVGVGLNISLINTAKNMIKQTELCEKVLK